MRTPDHTGSPRQLTLSLDPGISAKHMNLRSCMSAGVHRQGLVRVAGKIDLSPSALTEKLAGGNGRPRDIGLDEFERYLDSTDDREPIYYLIDKYLRDPAARQQEALSRLVSLAESLPALLSAAGLEKR